MACVHLLQQLGFLGPLDFGGDFSPTTEIHDSGDQHCI